MPDVATETGGPLAQFCNAGSEPSHSSHDSVFTRVGCAHADHAAPVTSCTRSHRHAIMLGVGVFNLRRESPPRSAHQAGYGP